MCDVVITHNPSLSTTAITTSVPCRGRCPLDLPRPLPKSPVSTAKPPEPLPMACGGGAAYSTMTASPLRQGGRPPSLMLLYYGMFWNSRSLDDLVKHKDIIDCVADHALDFMAITQGVK